MIVDEDGLETTHKIAAPGKIRLGDLELDFVAHRASRHQDGTDLKLTHMEFALLHAVGDIDARL